MLLALGEVSMSTKSYCAAMCCIDFSNFPGISLKKSLLLVMIPYMFASVLVRLMSHAIRSIVHPLFAALVIVYISLLHGSSWRSRLRCSESEIYFCTCSLRVEELSVEYSIDVDNQYIAAVKFICGSASISKTFLPRSDSAKATLCTNIVLPTHPL
jgi:hypothetical protein